jgi:hypothetical protein
VVPARSIIVPAAKRAAFTLLVSVIFVKESIGRFVTTALSGIVRNARKRSVLTLSYGLLDNLWGFQSDECWYHGSDRYE